MFYIRCFLYLFIIYWFVEFFNINFYVTKLLTAQLPISLANKLPRFCPESVFLCMHILLSSNFKHHLTLNCVSFSYHNVNITILSILPHPSISNTLITTIPRLDELYRSDATFPPTAVCVSNVSKKHWVKEINI